jgi:hypothetical protein
MGKPVTKLKAVGSPQAARVGDVREHHPDLLLVEPDYTECRDAIAGATTVKQRGTVYLPMPSGFNGSAAPLAMYDAYKMRAQFPDLLAPTVQGMLGIIHHGEAYIEGLEEDKPLADMWEKATPEGLPLETLHKRITEEILTVGRVALLVDLPPEGGDLPWVAFYKAESLINWSESRNFFVLEEDYRVRNGFSWEAKKRYRILELVDGVYQVEVVDEDGKAILDNSEAENQDVEEGIATSVGVPQVRGGNTLEEIPLVVAGSRDLSMEPDQIPLIGVTRSAYAIYRLDADYRHQLFMSGQETLFYIGLAPEDVPDYVGAGVGIAIPEGGDAKYVGPSGAGIDAHKTAIEDERATAAEAGSRMFAVGDKKSAESGEALRIRARAGSATLVSVAQTSAAALEKVLRYSAMLVGQDPEEIIVKPNLNFLDSDMTADEANKHVELWMNKVISYETLYENLQRGRIASEERTAEEEQELVAEEEAASMPEDGMGGAGAGQEPQAGATPDLTEGTGTDEYGDVSQEEVDELFAPEEEQPAPAPAPNAKKPPAGGNKK